MIEKNDSDHLKTFFEGRLNWGSKNRFPCASGLETMLNLPDKLVYNWLKGVKYRDLGDHENVVVAWAKTLGYDPETQYSPFI